MVTRKKPTAARKGAKAAKSPAKPVRAKPAAKKVAAKKAPVRKTVARKAVKKPVAKTPVAKKAVAKKKVAKKSVVKTASAKKTIAKKTIAKPAVAPKVSSASTPVANKKPATAPRARRKITPEKALANTLALLEAKNEKAKQPPNYPTGDAAHPGSNAPHGEDAERETAPTERNPDAIHGHALATERGNQSNRGQS